MEVAIIVLLILLNGFFSMSEIALVSARRFKLEAAARKGSAGAKQALELAGNPNTFLSAVQIGITLIGILTGLYSGEQVTHNVRAFIGRVPALVPYSETLSVVVVLIVLTFFSLVFGELIPKRLGLTFPERIATSVARPMMVVSTVTRPFIWLLTRTNDAVLRLFGIREKTRSIVSEEEIRALVQESAEGGAIRPIEQDIVEQVFALGDRSVGELMTHRSDLAWLDIHDGLEAVKLKVAATLHSVYPVADGGLDKLVGVVAVKDLFPHHFTAHSFSLQPFVRRPLYVHENTAVYKVLEQFRQKQVHYAVIVDEYGDIEGMIGMDDVVDTLLGDITPYSGEDYGIRVRDAHSWLADGGVPFFEFLDYFELPGEVVEGDFNTLAGFLLHQLHHIPVAGEVVRWKGFRFEILDMDDRRIDKVLISKE